MASRKRPEVVNTRLTVAERKEVELAAADDFDNMAAYVRHVVLADARQRLRDRVFADSGSARDQ